MVQPHLRLALALLADRFAALARGETRRTPVDRGTQCNNENARVQTCVLSCVHSEARHGHGQATLCYD